MSRKYDRQYHINKKALEIIEDPYTLFMLGSKLIRKKPKLMPRFVWKALLYVALAPSTRKTHGDVDNKRLTHELSDTSNNNRQDT
jgi:hypothetical protein